MNLFLRRELLTDKSTIGKLFIEAAYFCFTLEDVVRTGPKVYGKTAIPVGRYKVVITESSRFKKRLPLLLDVPDFTGVRIHAGNTATDTDGCILVGLLQGENSIGQSQMAMATFLPIIEASLQDGGECWLSISNPGEN